MSWIHLQNLFFLTLFNILISYIGNFIPLKLKLQDACVYSILDKSSFTLFSLVINMHACSMRPSRLQQKVYRLSNIFWFFSQTKKWICTLSQVNVLINYYIVLVNLKRSTDNKRNSILSWTWKTTRNTYSPKYSYWPVKFIFAPMLFSLISS